MISIGYHTYPSPKPSVQVIKIKTEAEVSNIIQQKQICDLQIYFLRPYTLYNLLYCDFFQKYTYGKVLPNKFKNTNINNSNPQYFDIYVSYLSTKYFIYEKESSYSCITRIEMVPLTIGEKWYLRLLLLHLPAISFKDIKTYENKLYETYQSAALAAKLVEDENEALTAFEWALNYSTPAELRNLFVIMTTQGFPKVNIFGNDILRRRLMEDFLFDEGSNNNIR